MSARSKYIMLFVNEKYTSIQNIMNEATFSRDGSNGDYSKYNYLYPLAVIDKLLNKEIVRLGKKGDGGEIDGATLTRTQISALKNLKANIDGTTSKAFDAAINNPRYSWSNIFKGDFSGYAKGLASKNKGNAFEAQFIAEFDKFEPELKKLVGYEKLMGDPRPDGGKNQKRPLTFSGGKITCGPAGDNNIGHTVTDVTVPVSKCSAAPNGELYLSLKYGNTVTFVNAGVKTLFTKAFFAGEEDLSVDAKALLKMLCINPDRFREVFTTYKGKAPGEKKSKAQKEKVDITDELKRNATFKTFMQSVMGYGFVLVHQSNNGNVDFIDLTTESALNEFIADIKKAHIEYPKPGEAKRVDVVIKYPKIEFKINIRSKDGGVLPTHIMADYKFIR